MPDSLIQFLKQSSGYVSGEELSRKIGVSRAGIWKYIEELRKLGYRIEALPNLGYKLKSIPDKLLPQEIQSGLKTNILGKEIIYFDTIDSTMNVAFQKGMEGAKEGTVVIAEGQSKGRGRMGRSWVSPKGKGIYMSVILRPKLSPTDVAKLTLLSAVCASEAIQEMCGLDAKIKWPNDILIGGKKIAGILTELSAEMDRVRFVVIGMGININASQTQLPDHATSLKAETGHSLSRVEFLQLVLLKLEQWYSIQQKQGFAVVFKRWKELSSTLGRKVRMEDPSGIIEGRAVDLDEFGGLVIENSSGVKVKRMSGDVVYV